MGDLICERCNGPTVEKFDGAGMSVCSTCDFHMYWPPVGEHAKTWEKFQALGFPEEEWFRLSDVLRRWIDEGSTLVAYTDDDGQWVNVEWPWSSEDS